MANKAILVQGGDGTAIPAGMVGYVKESVITSAVGISTTIGTYTDVATITLDKGQWEIECCANFFAVVSGSGSVIVALAITDNTPTLIRASYGSSIAATFTGYAFSYIKCRVSVTSDGTVFRARASFLAGSGSPTLSTSAVSGDATSPLVLRATLVG